MPAGSQPTHRALLDSENHHAAAAECCSAAVRTENSTAAICVEGCPHTRPSSSLLPQGTAYRPSLVRRLCVHASVRVYVHQYVRDMRGRRRTAGCSSPRAHAHRDTPHSPVASLRVVADLVVRAEADPVAAEGEGTGARGS